MSLAFQKTDWALVLGGSSGFGLATAKKLAACGMSVAVVHRDRRGAMPAIESEFDVIRATGVGFRAFNLDALSAHGRKIVLDEIAPHGRGHVKLLMHSVAYGNLKPLYGEELMLEEEDFARTIHAMGTSLVEWVQDVLARGLFSADARVVGMTSEGSAVAWRTYAAVSAAKAALEAVTRSIAVELAPHGVRANVVQAGVTDTPALRLIPGAEQMKAAALRRNPFARLTTPEDVAGVIALLCTDEARWINGATIRVDGGEHIAG